MSKQAGPRLADRLPEPVVFALVRLQNRELPWQRRLRRLVLSRVPRSGSVSKDEYLAQAANIRGVRARVTNELDAHALRKANVRAVSSALEEHGVAHALVPGARTFNDRVAVSAEDRAAALRAVAEVLVDPEWAVEPASARPSTLAAWRRARPVRRLSPRSFGRHGSLRVFRVLAGTNGEVAASAELACSLDFWTPVTSPDLPRPDGGMFEIDTRLAPDPLAGIVAYLSPESWQAATSAAGHWPVAASRSTLFQVREPIDIVYTWVDGEDPEWLARKASSYAQVAPGEVNYTAAHGSRFESRNELRYSLRSVATYASWVRKIFIVTDRQVPPWLDVDHPKIEIVDHSQIFTDPSALPVFNSHAIESQLHHIPDLSEHYLYLNDDVFFGRPVQPEQFFHGNGVGKFFLSTATLNIDPPSIQDLPVMSAAKRNREFIEARFGATVIHKFKHTPHPQLRSVLEEMEKNHPDTFSAVARSRFRHPDDLSITSALHHYYAYAIGRAMPAAIRYAYHDIARADTARRLSNLTREHSFDVFCLNDHETDPQDLEKQRRLLDKFFERYFPVPSPYELSDVGATPGPSEVPARGGTDEAGRDRVRR